MPEDDKYKKRLEDEIKRPEEELHGDETGDAGTGTETGTGTGGAAGHIEFHDFLSPADKSRDDLLPPEEKRRLLSVHKDVHELRVKKQKDLLQTRKDLKQGKIPLQAFRDGYGRTGVNANYKANPILAQAAQFSNSVDKQVNTVPTEQIAETNQDKRNELQYQHQLRHRQENVPRFHPKPQFNR